MLAQGDKLPVLFLGTCAHVFDEGAGYDLNRAAFWYIEGAKHINRTVECTATTKGAIKSKSVG